VPGVHCGINKNACTLLIQFTLTIILLCPPSPILRTVSTGVTFPFSCMSAWYFRHIHPPAPFLISSPSHWCLPTGRACFTFLYSIFEKRDFCLLKITNYTGSFIMTFPSIYVFYLKLYMPFTFLLSSLVIFQW
jgi:hypothetical protein